MYEQFVLAQAGFVNTDTGTDQGLLTAVDVCRFDTLDLMLTTVFDGTFTNPSLTVQIMTGTQLRTLQGWFQIGALVAANPPASDQPPNTQLLRLGTSSSTGFLKYIRWKVNKTGGFTGGATAARFRIDGIGRYR